MECEICKKDLKTKSGYVNHVKNCEKTFKLKDKIIKMYIEGSSIKEINNKMKISKEKIMEYLKGYSRSSSESGILAHKKYPDKFKHTEESKLKMRNKRLEYMKNNPEKTAWRLANLSYPEKLLLNKFIELEWYRKYLIYRERTFFPYFIDFAFENEKVAVEIDGSQHLEAERKKSDDNKDELLIKDGWSVIRFSESEIKTNINECIDIILDKLNNKSKPQKYIVGILDYPKKKINKYGNRKEYFEIKKEEYKRVNKDKVLQIQNSDIDFSKQGWVKKVSKIIGISENHGGKWIKKNIPELYEKCWKRK